MLRPLAARGSAQRLSVAKVRLASVGPHLLQRGRGSARLRRRGGGARRRLLATHALLLQLIPDGVCGRPVPPALGGHPRVEPLLHSLRHAPLQDGLGGGRFVLPHAHLRGGTPALRLRRLPGLPPGGSTGAAQLLRRRASKEKKVPPSASWVSAGADGPLQVLVRERKAKTAFPFDAGRCPLPEEVLPTPLSTALHYAAALLAHCAAHGPEPSRLLPISVSVHF